MNGEIGALFQHDKQVGGVYNWSINLAIDVSTNKELWYEYKVKKVITAHSYWLVSVPADNCFEAKFYKKIKGQLVLMDDGMVVVDLPDTTTLNRVLDAPLEIVWRNRIEY